MREGKEKKQFVPHDYQKRGIDTIIQSPSVALWWEPGLGKTVTTLSAILELWLDRLQVGRVLIIAPLKVAESTWQNEIEEWEHLTPFTASAPAAEPHHDARGSLRGAFQSEKCQKPVLLNPVTTIIGGRQQRIEAYERAKSSVISIINRDNVLWLTQTVIEKDKGKWPWDMVVIDEATSFKNPSAKRFQALKKFRGQIRRVVELTGTPASNGLMDLWAQMYLLDGGKRLERTITAYRNRYFNHNEWTHQWSPKDGSERIIMDKVSDLCHSLTAAEYLSLPDFVVEDVRVDLTPAQFLRYKKFEKTSVLEILKESKGSEVIAPGSAAVLTNKLLQYSSGAVYDEDGTVHELHEEKLKVFREILEALSEPVLVFYKFRFDLDRITAELDSQHKRYRVYRTEEDLNLWNNGELDVLVASPESCGYGLNLQHGGRRILWYTTTWSHEVYTQANARLYRQGQTKPVIVQRLITTGTVDERVRAVLDGKASVHDFVMEYVKDYAKEFSE